MARITSTYVTAAETQTAPVGQRKKRMPPCRDVQTISTRPRAVRDGKRRWACDESWLIWVEGDLAGDCVICSLISLSFGGVFIY